VERMNCEVVIMSSMLFIYICNDARDFIVINVITQSKLFYIYFIY